jgi:hypothetical protein
LIMVKDQYASKCIYLIMFNFHMNYLFFWRLCFAAHIDSCWKRSTRIVLPTGQAAPWCIAKNYNSLQPSPYFQ